jgi:hypothetical protein
LWPWPSGAELIATAAHGLDVLGILRIIQLLPQPRDVHIKGRRVHFALVSPDLLKNFFAGKDAIAVKHQILQQLKFFRRQGNRSINGGGADYSGSNFLRGYQHTDSNGQVSFTTIYSGWYSGRTVHIHIKVRIFDSSGNVTTEATTQLFFADSISTAFYAASPAYSRSGTRDTLNSSDGIYDEEDPALLVSLAGDTSSDCAGTVSIGILEGTICGG